MEENNLRIDGGLRAVFQGQIGGRGRAIRSAPEVARLLFSHPWPLPFHIILAPPASRLEPVLFRMLHLHSTFVLVLAH